jgi:capsular polysaccharide export protein
VTEAERIIEYSFKKLLADFAWLRPVQGVLRKWLIRKARLFYRLFHEKFQNEATDLIVLWSGLALPLAAAAQAARAIGIKTLFCENGYLPGTIVMDPDGVNAVNSLMDKEREFYEAVVVDAGQWTALLESRLTQRPLKRKKAAARESIVADTERKYCLSERFFFLPLQVFDDSQILLYSPRFPDMRSLIRYCAGEVGEFNRTHQTDYGLVIKEHPSDCGRINYHTIQRELPGITFVRALSSQELIDRSTAVITVNSTVGIEGLLMMKPVITLGETFYNVPGLVYHVGIDQPLAEKIAEALTKKVDKELVHKFLYYLWNNYLIQFNRNTLEPTRPLAAVNRIMQVFSNTNYQNNHYDQGIKD